MKCPRVLAFTLAIGAGAAARAAVITTPATDPFTVANNGQAPGAATDYTFFGGGAQQPAAVQTNFTVTRTANSQFSFAAGNTAYSFIKAPGGGTAFETGIAYQNAGGAAANIATFQLKPGLSGNFSVYILENNTDGNGVGNSGVSLVANSGTPVSVTTSSVGQPKNEFVQFDVTGATAGDVFTINVTPTGGNFPSIGGVTFSAVPEPGSLSLLAAGGLAVLARRRRRGG